MISFKIQQIQSLVIHLITYLSNLRDQNEERILGSNRCLGFYFVMGVELWGILDGLTILLEQDYDNVLIQSDSMEAILAIQAQVGNNSYPTFIRRIH